MIYLASASPRRQELLRQIGLEFEVLPSHVDEIRRPDESPRDYVRRVANDKARAVAGMIRTKKLADYPILAADTEVIVDGDILGKPRDRRHAAEMVARLAGRRHQVLSAICLLSSRGTHEAVSESEVTFSEMTPEDIARYVETGEADDKAGGYAIQGRAAQYICRLDGSYSGVMGLPLCELRGVMVQSGLAT